MEKPRVVIVDARRGRVYSDGRNIDLPSEGQEAMLRAIETADVLIEISIDGVWVKEGVEKGWVVMVTTKDEEAMSMEKAQREKAARQRGPEMPTGMKGDRPTFDDDPVDQKFARVWEGDSKSGPTRPLRGY